MALRGLGRFPNSLEARLEDFSPSPSQLEFTALTTQELSSEHADMPRDLQPEVVHDGSVEKSM